MSTVVSIHLFEVFVALMWLCCGNVCCTGCSSQGIYSVLRLVRWVVKNTLVRMGEIDGGLGGFSKSEHTAITQPPSRGNWRDVEGSILVFSRNEHDASASVKDGW